VIVQGGIRFSIILHQSLSESARNVVDRARISLSKSSIDFGPAKSCVNQNLADTRDDNHYASHVGCLFGLHLYRTCRRKRMMAPILLNQVHSTLLWTEA